MGKQKGKQQRTKGNVGPSSSAKSADLLSKEYDHADSGMFQTMLTGGLGNVPELEGLDTVTNPEFRIILKKLTKHDRTTKLKALSEFIELCQDCSPDEVLNILPFWPRIYGRLFEDSDRRVRENGQKAMHALVKSVGKNLAPHLKSFMGHWFLSQCDPYSPCAFEAEASLACAFRNEKKLDAFVFCRTEILKLISMYLFKPFPHTSKQEKSPEEGNNIHRIVACAIEAFALYIKTVSKRKPFDEEIITILDNTRFWKFPKHQYPPARGAFYSVIEALCLAAPDLLEKHLSEACKAVFHRLDEGSIAVCKPIFGAAVALTVSFPDWHELVDIQKGVIPNICSSLKSGCHGMTGIVLPSLLPLLSKFPSSNSFNIFSKVLSAVRECMYHEQVRNSRPSLKLATATHIELVRLAATQLLLVTKSEATDWIQMIVSDHIISQLNACFQGKESKFKSELFYELVSKAIKSWTMKSQQVGNGALEELCKAFWVELNNLVCTYAKEPNVTTAHEIAFFFSELVEPVASKPTQRTIHFCDGAHHATNSSTKEGEQRQPVSEHEVSPNSIRGRVNCMVVDHILKHPLPDSESTLMIHLDIVKRLGSVSLFKTLSANYSSLEHPNALEYFNHVLVPDVTNIAHAPLKKETVVMLSDILFHCLACCGEISEIPEGLVALCHAGDNGPQFDLFFQLSSRIASDPNCLRKSLWLGRLLEDVTSDNWHFIQVLIKRLTPCECDNSQNLSEKEGWTFLERLLSSEAGDEGKNTYLCSQNSFENLLNGLLERWQEVKHSCNCFGCIYSVTENILLLMTSCTRRNFDYSVLSGSDSNIWLTMVNSLTRSFFMMDTMQTGTVDLLSTVYKHVSDTICSDAGSREVNAHFGSLMAWLKDSILLQQDCPVDGSITKMKEFIQMLIPLLPDLQISALTLLDDFLPNSQDWDKVRHFQCEQWSDPGSVISNNQLPRHFSASLPSSKAVPHAYLAAVLACHEILAHIVEQGMEIALEGNEKVLRLCEEMAVAHVIGDDDINVLLFAESIAGNISERFRYSLLEKSSNVGGVWPYCIEKLRLAYDNEVSTSLFRKLCESTDSEVSLSLVQTGIAISRVSPDMPFCSLSLKWMRTVKPASIASREMYMFSLAVNLLQNCSSDSNSVENNPVIDYLDLAISWRKENESLFLFDKDIDSASGDLLLLNSDIAQCFAIAVKRYSGQLSEEHWDLICCAVVSWLEGLVLTSQGSPELPVLMFRLLYSVCSVVIEIDSFMASPTLRDDPTVPSNLANEWTEFFSMSAYPSLIQVFLSITKNIPMLCEFSVSAQLCKSLRNVRITDIKTAGLHLKPHLSAASSLPENVQTLLHHFQPLLRPQPSVEKGFIIQMTAHEILMKVLPEMKSAEGNVTPPQSMCTELERLSHEIKPIFAMVPVAVKKAVSAYNSDTGSDSDEDIPSLAQEEFKIRVQESTSQLLAYLLSWRLLIRLTRQLPSEKKAQYIDTLMKGVPSIAEDLLPKLFKLMPEEQSYFKNDLDFSNCDMQEGDLGHLACITYKEFLLEMPAAARMWFNDLPKSMRAKVDQFTSTYVSPVLVENELKAILPTRQQQVTEGMQIVARPATGEVLATYSLNEVEMEITVCLPSNHPLGNIAVNTHKRAGVVMGQWRYWILQITTFLQYQNGGIIDGLLLWKERVDKRFGGLEECMICFSLVHGSNQSLPKLKCKTCKKKYHAECLYKWFDTSNNSTCPLCRTPMIFR